MNDHNPYTLDHIEVELSNIVEKKEVPQSGYIIKYKGQRLVMDSGKKLWTSPSAAKNALMCHFEWYKNKYSIPPTEKYVDPYGVERQNYDYSQIDSRKAEFRKKLLSYVEIVQLTE